MASSDSAEPGLDPGGERTPGLFADTGLEAVWGLERGQTQERLEAGRLAEAGLLHEHASSAVSSAKTNVSGPLNTQL